MAGSYLPSGRRAIGHRDELAQIVIMGLPKSRRLERAFNRDLERLALVSSRSPEPADARRPKAPNLILRGIREQERHETREEFADSMARVADEMGESIFPTAKYVERLESGHIRFPRPLHRRVLAQLCGRPFSELGFAAAPLLARDNFSVPEECEASSPDAVSPLPSRLNLPLRDAVMASGMEVTEIARKIGVDPKTVQRWLTRGVTPHLRHRWKTAETLGRHESELWQHLTRRPECRTAEPLDTLSSARQVSPAITELCGVLTDYGFDLGRFGSTVPNETPAPGDLERDLKIAFNAYQQSRFTAAASRISTLLADAQATAKECRGAERARVLRVLALSYQAAASVLTKVGEPDIAWIAAERGLNAADDGDSLPVRGSLIRSVAFALLSAGHLEPAMRLVESGAAYLEGEIAGDDTMLSVYGTLFLAGSMAAARFGDGPRTSGYLQEANSAARRLGKDANHLWTAFGPTNVAIHRVNTAAELGDIKMVLESGPSLNTDAVPAERRVRCLIDVARAYSLVGNRDDALGTMLTAERIAPEQVRQHHLSKKVVMTLMRSTIGKPSVELDRLARRVNVSESA